MKSPSLDKFYTLIDKHVLLAEGYTEIKELSFLIKSCRLKPYDYLISGNKKLMLHRHWVDEFGNSLYIGTNKRLKITYGDLSVDKQKIISTDLYYGLSVSTAVKFSKLVHLLIAHDEDYGKCAILTCLGIDNYFRTFTLLDGEWSAASPLILGINNLKNIIYNKDIKYFKELTVKENIYMPCLSPKAWLTYIPSNKVLLSLLKKEDEAIVEIITTKG